MKVERTIISVHAHPDDEASKGAAIIAKYKAQGARAVLVTATGGEEGDILNKAMDTPSVSENLPEVRKRELFESAAIIGYDRVEMLEYRDSGMVDSQANKNPNCFARADLDEAASKLVKIIREEKPSVMLTYPEIQSRYPHPDHVQVYVVSMRAVELASDPQFAPELGGPHKISKIYYHIWTRSRIVALHKKFLELGLESPFSPDWFESIVEDYVATTKISTVGFGEIKNRALVAHATQIDPSSPFWFGLETSDADEAYPTEDLFLACAPEGYQAEGIEDDIFAGIE